MRQQIVADYLNRSGAIIERARREGRSLDRVERNIIMAGRRIAIEKGVTRERINALEMDGERDWQTVRAALKVQAEFAYYDAPFEDLPACPHYFVRVSNHPSLVEGGHVDASQLLDAGQKVPRTPTYSEWMKGGQRVVRA